MDVATAQVEPPGDVTSEGAVAVHEASRNPPATDTKGDPDHGLVVEREAADADVE